LSPFVRLGQDLASGFSLRPLFYHSPSRSSGPYQQSPLHGVILLPDAPSARRQFPLFFFFCSPCFRVPLSAICFFIGLFPLCFPRREGVLIPFVHPCSFLGGMKVYSFIKFRHGLLSLFFFSLSSSSRYPPFGIAAPGRPAVGFLWSTPPISFFPGWRSVVSSL